MWQGTFGGFCAIVYTYKHYRYLVDDLKSDLHLKIISVNPNPPSKPKSKCWCAVPNNEPTVVQGFPPVGTVDVLGQHKRRSASGTLTSMWAKCWSIASTSSLVNGVLVELAPPSSMLKEDRSTCERYLGMQGTKSLVGYPGVQLSDTYCRQSIIAKKHKLEVWCDTFSLLVASPLGHAAVQIRELA